MNACESSGQLLTKAREISSARESLRKMFCAWMLAKTLDNCWQKLARSVLPAKACESCVVHQWLRKLWTIVDNSLRDQFCPRKLGKVVLCMNACESSGQLLTTAYEISSAGESLRKMLCAWQPRSDSPPPFRSDSLQPRSDGLRKLLTKACEINSAREIWRKLFCAWMLANALGSCWQKLANSQLDITESILSCWASIDVNHGSHCPALPAAVLALMLTAHDTPKSANKAKDGEKD